MEGWVVSRRAPPKRVRVMLDPKGHVCGFLERDGRWSHVLIHGRGYTEMAYGPVRSRRKRSKKR